MAVREERNIWELLGVGKDGEVSAKPAGDRGTSAEAFLAAIRTSDIKRIQRIIEKGSDINTKLLPDGSTPLHLACREGFHDVVDYLIVRGADINIRDAAGKTALQYQAQAANSSLASNGTLQPCEEQPEEAVDELNMVNELSETPEWRCNGQGSIQDKKSAQLPSTSSMSQNSRSSLAGSTPNLAKLHSLKQALSSTRGKRKREGKDHAFSGSKRIPGQNGLHGMEEGTRSTSKWASEAKRITSKDLGTAKHAGGDDRHHRKVAMYTPTPIATLNGSKTRETEKTLTDDSEDELTSSAMTVTLPGSIINVVSKVNGNSTIKSSRTPERDNRKTGAGRSDVKVVNFGPRDPRTPPKEGRYAGMHVSKDPRLASRRATQSLLQTASASPSVGFLQSSAAMSNHNRFKYVNEEHALGSQPKKEKTPDEKASETRPPDAETLVVSQNSHSIRRHKDVKASSSNQEEGKSVVVDTLDSKQNTCCMEEELVKDLLQASPLPEVHSAGKGSSTGRTSLENCAETSDEETSGRPPPLLHKNDLTGIADNDVGAEKSDIPSTMVRAAEYDMDSNQAKSEAAENDGMCDLTTPLQIRIPKPREAILQRHALPPELSPQGDSHLLQTYTDNGPLDLSLKRNGSATAQVQSAGSSASKSALARNTLQPPVLSPKPIPPVPSSMEMASLRTRSSPALLSPDIARSPVPIMQDSPLSETARHSPNTVMYNPLTLPIARGLSGRPDPQILPPLSTKEKIPHPAASVGVSTVHGIPMATVVPSVVRNWGGYIQNGAGMPEVTPSNMFMRPSASDMMGLLASTSVLTRRTPTLEQLLKTPSMVHKSQTAPALSTATVTVQSAPTVSTAAATVHPIVTSVLSTATDSTLPMASTKHLADATLVRPIPTSALHRAQPVTSPFKHAVQPLIGSSQLAGMVDAQVTSMPNLSSALGILPFHKESTIHGTSETSTTSLHSTFEHSIANAGIQSSPDLANSPAHALLHDRPGAARSPLTRTTKEAQLEIAVSRCGTSRNNDVNSLISSSQIHESSHGNIKETAVHTTEGGGTFGRMNLNLQSTQPLTQSLTKATVIDKLEEKKLTIPVSSQHPVLAVPPMVVDSAPPTSERNIWSKLIPLGPFGTHSPRNFPNSPRDAREQEVAEILSNMSTPLGSPAQAAIDSPSPSPHPREAKTSQGEGETLGKYIGAFPCLESMLHKPPMSLSEKKKPVPTKAATPNRTIFNMQQSKAKTRISPPAKVKGSPEVKTRSSLPARLRPTTDSKMQTGSHKEMETANSHSVLIGGYEQPMPTIKIEASESKANVSPMRASKSPHSIRTTPANIAAMLSMKSSIPPSRSPSRSLFNLVTSSATTTTSATSASTSGFPFSSLGLSLTKTSPTNTSHILSPAYASTAVFTTGGSLSIGLEPTYSQSQPSDLSAPRLTRAGNDVSQCHDEDNVAPMRKGEQSTVKLPYVYCSTHDLSPSQPVGVTASDAVLCTANNSPTDLPDSYTGAGNESAVTGTVEESATLPPSLTSAGSLLDTTSTSSKKPGKVTKTPKISGRRGRGWKGVRNRLQKAAEKSSKESPQEAYTDADRMPVEEYGDEHHNEVSDYSTDMRRYSESSGTSDAADTGMDSFVGPPPHRSKFARGRRAGPLSRRQEREFRRLKDSEGFVRDKKPPKTMNLYEDTSLLGREQRYLQRAMMRFQEMELKDKGLPVEAVVRKAAPKPVGMGVSRGRGGRYIGARHPYVTVQQHGPGRSPRVGHPRGRRRGLWQRGVERPRKIRRTTTRTSECSNSTEIGSQGPGDSSHQQKTAHMSDSVSRNTTGVKEDSELFRPEMIYSRKTHLVVRKPGFQDFYPTILPNRTRGVAAANFSKYARKSGQTVSTSSMKLEAHRRARRNWARKAASETNNQDDPEKSGFVDLNNLKVRINLKDLYRSNLAQQRKKLLKKCCSSAANMKVVPEQLAEQLSPKIKIQKCLVTEEPSSKGRYFARRTGGHPAFTYKVTSCNMSPSPVPDIPQEETQELRRRPGRKRGPPKALIQDGLDISLKPGGKRKYKSRHLEPEEEPALIPASVEEEDSVDNELVHIKQEPLSDEETVEYEEEEEEGPHPDLPPMPPEMKKLLIQKSSGETVLHRASRLGYEEVVHYCLETRYVDVNSQDNAGYSPLHEACVRGHMSIVQDLILFGADVNCSAQDGTRPIHDAVENDHVEIVRMLLSYGADPCLATYSGRTISSLCRSDTMETFITDHFRDLAGREEDDSNEGVWEFTGSSAIMEDRSEVNGMDVFADIPKEEVSDVDDFEFEMAERPHLPSYNLLINLTEGCRNYLLVDDVISQLEMSREQLLTKLDNQTPVRMSKSSFLTQISESQVAELPNSLVGCSGREEPARSSPPLSASDTTSPGAVQENDQEVPGGTSFAKNFPFGERKVPDQVHVHAAETCTTSYDDAQAKASDDNMLESYEHDVALEREGDGKLSDTLLTMGDWKEDASHSDDPRTIQNETDVNIVHDLSREEQDVELLEGDKEENGRSCWRLGSGATLQVAKQEAHGSCASENGDKLGRKLEDSTDTGEIHRFIDGNDKQTADSVPNGGPGQILNCSEAVNGERCIAGEHRDPSVTDQRWTDGGGEQQRQTNCRHLENPYYVEAEVCAEDEPNVVLTGENDDMAERETWTKEELIVENFETDTIFGTANGEQKSKTPKAASVDSTELVSDERPSSSDLCRPKKPPILLGTEHLNVWMDTNNSNQSNNEHSLIDQSEHEPMGTQSAQSAEINSGHVLASVGTNEKLARPESVGTRYNFESGARKTEEQVVELLELTSGLKELLGILTEKL